MAALAVVSALLTLQYVGASLFCPHTVYPSSKEDLITATIQAKNVPGQEPYYRITDDEGDRSFKRLSSHFKLLTVRDNNECPFRGCLVELSPAEPKNHQTRLYQASVIGKLIPPGFFAMDVSKRQYCVLNEGDCGADVPLYRHYKVTGRGIFHAYTLDSSDIIEGYIKESTPLCFVWARNSHASSAEGSTIPPLLKLPKAPRFVSHEREFDAQSAEDNAILDIDELCSHDDQQAIHSSMDTLTEFFNFQDGLSKDHWYTTKKEVDSYNRVKTLGKVVTDVRRSKCKCLVEISQMKWSADIGIKGVDHKLVREKIEPMSLNQYLLDGEQFYCAPEPGACGATLPLRKFYNFGDADSMITVDSEIPPPMTAPLPADVLCYIWAENYAFEEPDDVSLDKDLKIVKSEETKSSEETNSSHLQGDIFEGSGSGDSFSSEESSSEENVAAKPKKIEKQPHPLKFQSE